MNSIIKTLEKEFFEIFGDGFTLSTANYPKYNLYKESDNISVIEIALAGSKKEDISIELEKNLLSISGEQRDKQDKSERVYFHKGLTEKSFKLSFKISENTKVQTAKFEDGILTIKLLYVEPESPSKNTIQID